MATTTYREAGRKSYTTITTTTDTTMAYVENLLITCGAAMTRNEAACMTRNVVRNGRMNVYPGLHVRVDMDTPDMENALA